MRGGQVRVERFLAGPDGNDGEVIAAVALLQQLDAQRAGVLAAIGDVLLQRGLAGRQPVGDQVHVADHEQRVRRRCRAQ